MKALITGITGQDGAYLAQFLLEKGYKVYGADNKIGGQYNWRLKALNIEDKVELYNHDITDSDAIKEILNSIKPDEIYNFAAISFVANSAQNPVLMAEINGYSVLRMIEAARHILPNVKFFQASTSEIFGNTVESPQNENTPFNPTNMYGISKCFAQMVVKNYRETYGMFACSGILYNHESPLRGDEFVTKKIISGVKSIKQGTQDKIVLGNIDSKRDWGYAPEYVEAMWLMLQHKTPEDYIIATGETHTVREFLELSFEYIGIPIEWQGIGVAEKGIDKQSKKVVIEISSEYYRSIDSNFLMGNCRKANLDLNWCPKLGFNNIVKLMLNA